MKRYGSFTCIAGFPHSSLIWCYKPIIQQFVHFYDVQQYDMDQLKPSHESTVEPKSSYMHYYTLSTVTSSQAIISSLSAPSNRILQ